MFANAEDIKSADDLKKPAAQLEFGRELDYFRPKSGPPTPGPVLLGTTMVYSIENASTQLFLFTSGNPEVPVSVVRKDDKTREIFWYGEYTQMPFDPKMFAKPDGVTIEDRQ